MLPLMALLLVAPSPGDVTTTLSLIGDAPKIGQPIKLKLEMSNVGAQVHTYDDQQAAVNGSLVVKGPEGEAVPYIEPGAQTLGFQKQLKPGDTVTIFDGLDLAAQYLIAKPGKYTVKFFGSVGLPGSNTLEINVADGQLPDRTKLLKALIDSVPKGWKPSHNNGAFFIINSPTRLKKDVASVSLTFTKTKVSKDAEAEYAGETRLGHAWIKAESPTVKNRWPEYRDKIREQLKVVGK